ncbi:MAG TPA: TonB-dependent receptor [Rubricoccaceae bacterium]
MPLVSLRRAGRASFWLSALALAAIGSATPAQAQRGALVGTLLDAETGETLIGATVAAAGTGTTTDLDGAYRLALDPGMYTVTFSYVGYDAQTVEGVVVALGQTVRLDRQLALASAGLGEVVVQADAVEQRNTDEAVLAIQARAPAILDGLSAQQIRRSPDATSGEALRRVTGVTVTGGRFVTIRGVPERYSTTLLNGAPVPSTEPDRRAFAFDLIPSGLLANVFVSKSATPDQPGDVAGGVLMLTTVDFPEAFTVSASVSTGVTNATGETIFRGSPTALPAGLPANIGVPAVTDEERAAFGRQLGSGFVLGRETGGVRPNATFSVGGSQQTALGRVGAVGALTYRSGYALNDAARREFEATGEPRFDVAGIQAGYAETAGGLLNLAWRPASTQSFSFKNFYNRTREDDVTQFTGVNAGDGNNVRETAVRRSNRSLYAGQLSGEHYAPAFHRAEATWTLFGARTTRDEPDNRRITYVQPSDDPTQPFRLLVGPTVAISSGGRFYSALDENSLGGRLDLGAQFGDARIKAGTWVERRDRDFTSRLVGVTIPNQGFDFALLDLPMDSIFAPQNFGVQDAPGCADNPRRPGCQGFLMSELQNGGNDYTAAQDVTAGYLMVDTPVTPLTRRLRFVGGVRLERAVQRLESTTFNREPLSLRTPTTNWLPSANLAYDLGHRTNLRLAYSRNVNRPELRELAPFAFYDFELQTTIYGNDSLRQATIHNVDLRIETFPGAGELLSASVFYKRFNSPIERAIVPGVSLNAERTFVNADYANTYGFEVEARHGLGFVAPWLSASSALVNYTWIQSDVFQPGTQTAAARTGRPLQGQAPYAVNLGLTLVSPRFGTAFTALYNRLGSRIVEVSSLLEADVVEAPRDLVDLSLSQPVMGRYTLRLNVRDLLGQNQSFLQGASQVRSDLRGRSVSFGISADL